MPTKKNLWGDWDEELIKSASTKFFDPYKDNTFRQEYEAKFPEAPAEDNKGVYVVSSELSEVDFADLETKIIQHTAAGKKAEISLKELSKAFEKMPGYQPGCFGIDPAKEEDVNEEDALFLQRESEELLVWYPRTTNHELGYGEATLDNGATRYFNTQDLLARFFIAAHTYHGAIHNWRGNCIGITNLYLDSGMGGKHMPMFDYDGKNVKTQIRKDAKLLQKEYGLGDAWVYETRRGFHVYFFCDGVDRSTYTEMLKVSGACKGFKRATEKRHYAVLRVSAKYTDFDIKFLYVLPAKDGKLRRMTRKAHVIRSLLALGEECGTHFASLYPQWAHYAEDPKEWKPPPKRRKGKRIRKAKVGSYDDWAKTQEAERLASEVAKKKKVEVDLASSGGAHYVVTNGSTSSTDAVYNTVFWNATTSTDGGTGNNSNGF